MSDPETSTPRRSKVRPHRRSRKNLTAGSPKIGLAAAERSASERFDARAIPMALTVPLPRAALALVRSRTQGTSLQLPLCGQRATLPFEGAARINRDPVLVGSIFALPKLAAWRGILVTGHAQVILPHDGFATPVPIQFPFGISCLALVCRGQADDFIKLTWIRRVV